VSGALDSKRVLDLFRSTGAMLEGHFELSSGLHSERYFQCALLLEDPKRAELLARELASSIREKRKEPFDVVIGPALGAVIWAHEVARALGARCQFTERISTRADIPCFDAAATPKPVIERITPWPQPDDCRA